MCNMISIPHGWQVVKENVTFGNRPKYLPQTQGS